MKYILLALFVNLCSFSFCGNLINRVKLPYQDILINNKVVKKGLYDRSGSYLLVSNALNRFKKPFTFLDLGAAQGYYSLRLAHDFPHSKCIMVDDNTSGWPDHGDLLEEICHSNSKLKNIVYLRKALTLEDLKYLNTHEHFDVLLASFVIHRMSQDLAEQKQIFAELLKLSDNVFLQVSHFTASSFTTYIEELNKLGECQYLGEVCRGKLSRTRKTYPKGVHPGYVFWFKSRRKNRKSNALLPLGIKKETFHKLGGCYPVEGI